MRVLQVISALHTGGAEKFVVQLVPALRQLGIDTQVLVLDDQRGIYHEELAAAGVTDVMQMDIRRYYNPWTAIRMVPRLGGYDVIHSHLFPTQYWVAMAAALRVPSTPLVTTEQNTNNRRRSMRFFQWLDRHMYRRYRAVVTVSPLAEVFLRDYIDHPRTRVMTIPNAIDLARFNGLQPAELHSLPGHASTDFHVLQIASFTPQKDHDTLIRALSKCPPTVKLLLVGEGPRLAAMQSLATELGVADRVHFLGIRSDVPELLRAADVAVMSSHYEGLSLAVLEAFAAGTAFVGTDAPGLGEIAREGGLSVRPNDADDLADTLQRLQTSNSLREELAHRGLAVASHYAIGPIAEQYVELYAGLTDGSPLSSAS